MDTVNQVLCSHYFSILGHLDGSREGKRLLNEGRGYSHHALNGNCAAF